MIIRRIAEFSNINIAEETVPAVPHVAIVRTDRLCEKVCRAVSGLRERNVLS